ncbi:MAG: hypothetical protein KBF12_12775 [Sebaldella sp.]|nr:hypothetical protein [Sebaldella sp.]
MEIKLKDFLSIGSNYLSGRREGESVYNKYKDKVDIKTETLDVIIPDNLIGINISFFLGMFDKFMKQLGREDKIREVVNFKIEGDRYKKYIENDIEEGIKEILDDKDIEESLK